MNNREVEARLERSLRAQIAAPRLGNSFDAAVLARIGAQQMAAPAAASDRWLLISNVIGLSVALVLVLYFSAGVWSDLELGFALPPLPQVSAGTVTLIVQLLVWPLTALALIFGLMFTPLGRRLRQELN